MILVRLLSRCGGRLEDGLPRTEDGLPRVVDPREDALDGRAVLLVSTFRSTCVAVEVGMLLYDRRGFFWSVKERFVKAVWR